MNAKILSENWRPYAFLLSFDGIYESLKLAEAVAKEEILHLVPNMQMADDGPTIKSVIIVTVSYIGEVRISPSGSEIDFSLLSSVGNYRQKIGVFEVSKQIPPIPPETEPKTEILKYGFAELKLIHTFSDNITTTATYFGENREDWLKEASATLPIEILKEGLKASR